MDWTKPLITVIRIHTRIHTIIHGIHDDIRCVWYPLCPLGFRRGFSRGFRLLFAVSPAVSLAVHASRGLSHCKLEGTHDGRLTGHAPPDQSQPMPCIGRVKNLFTLEDEGVLGYER